LELFVGEPLETSPLNKLFGDLIPVDVDEVDPITPAPLTILLGAT